MKINIMSLGSALVHIPKSPTYAIRIKLSEYLRDPEMNFGNLVESPLFHSVNEYVFDDIYSQRSDSSNVLFTPEIASGMLIDFLNERNGCDTLLVHCERGKNRSPAVAMAFNDIFHLGHDRDKLKSEYQGYNWHVYHVLMREARRSGI